MRARCLALAMALGPAQALAAEPDDFEAHFRRATEAYDARDYEGAIRELKAAYVLRQHPRLLLNLGQAYRSLGHARQALAHYEMYLSAEPNPQPELRAELERYIRQTRAMLEAARQLARTTNDRNDTEPDRLAQEGQPASGGEQPRLADDRRQKRGALVLTDPPPARPTGVVPIYRRWWFWTALGAVAAGGVTAGVLAAQPWVPPAPAYTLDLRGSLREVPR